MKGATNQIIKQAQKTEVSIHAPMKGATELTKRDKVRFSFNPRSHEGSDKKTF